MKQTQEKMCKRCFAATKRSEIKIMNQSYHTVCFFATVTKDDGITQPNDFTPMSAMNQFVVYCMAFVV